MKFSDEPINYCIENGYCHFDGDTIIISKKKTPKEVFDDLSDILEKDNYELLELHSVVFAIRRKK